MKKNVRKAVQIDTYRPRSPLNARMEAQQRKTSEPAEKTCKATPRMNKSRPLTGWREKAKGIDPCNLVTLRERESDSRPVSRS